MSEKVDWRQFKYETTPLNAAADVSRSAHRRRRPETRRAAYDKIAWAQGPSSA